MITRRIVLLPVFLLLAALLASCSTPPGQNTLPALTQAATPTATSVPAPPALFSPTPLTYKPATQPTHTPSPPVAAVPTSSPPTSTPSRTATATPTAPRLAATPPLTATATAVPTWSWPTNTATPTLPGRAGPAPAEIVRGNTSKRQVALTFDAGASAAPLPRILAVLRQRNVRASFFLTGVWATENPDGVKAIAADGHEIYNHSKTHPDFTTLSDAQIVRELVETEQIIQRLVERSTKPYFRPPFGARDGRVLAAAWSAGYRCVYWTVDSGDWREDATVDGVVGKILNNASNGAIFIQHVGSPQTAEGLPRVIAGLREKGYAIVPLSAIVE